MVFDLNLMQKSNVLMNIIKRSSAQKYAYLNLVLYSDVDPDSVGLEFILVRGSRSDSRGIK